MTGERCVEAAGAVLECFCACILPSREAEGTLEWWWRRGVTAGPRCGWMGDSEAEERSGAAENC